MQEMFRAIPSVDLCLKALLEADSGLADSPRAHLADLVAEYWDDARAKIRAGLYREPADLTLERQFDRLLAHIRHKLRPRLRRVLNGTGVIVHTNLGRSILCEEAAEAAAMAARGYCNLEMDLSTGERGSRHDITEDLIRRITGAEAALVVNNNAAAVLLILDTICSGGEAIVSRGELVEIGGSFRIPDIMAKSGATLREVGTTNRTHLKDYREAINENTRALLCVHTSNFRIIGFHTTVDLPELKALAVERNLPLIYDLGSGNIISFSQEGLPPEHTVAEILSGGADVVCFSGDKALGGPQAGIIAGKKELIGKFKKNPLTRALRCDKLCIAALEATLRHYLNPEKARASVPTPRMISASPEELAKNARSLGQKLRKAFREAAVECEIVFHKDSSRVGGGTFPESNLPTTLLCVHPKNCQPQELRDALLKTDPPLIGRLENDAFCLDPRTLQKAEWNDVAKVIVEALKAQ